MNCNDSFNTSTPLLAVACCSCTMSIAGAILIILTFIMIPEIRNTTRKVVTVLAVADLLTPLGIVMIIIREAIVHQVDTGVFCTIQSAITTYSSMVSFFVTVVIAIHLFCELYYQSKGTGSTKRMVVAMIISWGVPGIIVGVALHRDMLGRSNNSRVGTGPWCWVKCKDDWNETKVYLFLTGKAWELLCYLFSAGFFVLLKLQLFLRYKYKTFRDISPNLRDDDQNFLYVWLVLLLLRIWGTIRFFLVVIQDHPLVRNELDSVLLYLQTVGDPSQAFVNCILFCVLDKIVRKKLISICCTHIQVCLGKNNIFTGKSDPRKPLLDQVQHNASADNSDGNETIATRDNTRSGDEGPFESISEITPIHSKVTKLGENPCQRHYMMYRSFGGFSSARSATPLQSRSALESMF